MAEKKELGFDPTSDDLPAGMDKWGDDVISHLITKHKSSGKAKRQKLARDWFRSELFYNGIQWVTFDSKMKRWRESGIKKSTPQPVTNKYASYCDLFSSLIGSLPVETTYRPLNASDILDQGKVKIANELMEAIQQVTQMKKRQRESAPMVTRQGEVFLIPRLIKEGVTFETPQEEVPKENPDTPGIDLSPVPPPGQPPQMPGQPLAMPGMPEQPPVSGMEQLAQSHMSTVSPVLPGLPETPSVPQENFPSIPKLVIEVASAFECYMDEEADTLEDSAFFHREKSIDISILKAMFPKIADRIHAANRLSGEISRYFAGSLSRLTSGEFGTSGYFLSTEQTSSQRANFIEYWHDPCKNYEKGIYAIMVNDVVVHADDLPYSDPVTGKHYKNIVHIRAKKRTKNIHGRTPLDDAIPKQVQRNKLESFIELIIYRMAAPHWLLPKDCGIESMSGEPGTSLNYNRVSASQTSVLKPEMVAGIPPHPVLMQWLERIDQDTMDILGITQALMGQLPPNTPAARALELLIQRSKERHGDVFAEWNAGWAECLNMLLKIARQTKPVDLFKATQRTYGGFLVKRFQENDFDINLEIVPETEAPSPPMSTAAEIQMIQEFAKEGVFQMPAPLQYEILNRAGMDFLIKGLEADKQYIERENYELIHNNILPNVQTFDNHPMHFEDQRIFIQTEEFQEWAKSNQEKAMNFVQHVQAHQQLAQPPAPPQIPPGPQPGMQPQPQAA